MTELEDRLRTLSDRVRRLTPEDDLVATVRSRHRRHRRRRLVVATAAVAALAVVGGSVLATGALRTTAAPTASRPPSGPAPTDPRLLPWPSRGPLVDDTALVDRVLHYASIPDRGVDKTVYSAPHLLWIGPASDAAGPVQYVVVRYAVVQRYLVSSSLGGRPGLYLELWSAGPNTIWHLAGSQRISRDLDAISIPWPSFPVDCNQKAADAPGCDQARVLVLGAPDVRSISYTFPGAPARTVASVDGTAVGTGRVPLLRMTVDQQVPIPARVTHADGRAGDADSSMQLRGARLPTSLPVPAVEWLPPRGLPPLLDAPETFPGLDLWGRLHGLSERPPYGNPVWGGTLADGSRAVLAQPRATPVDPYSLVFAVTPRVGTTFLVRDLPNPAEPKTVAQVSAFLPLSDGRCELVVVGRPGTTAVSFGSTDLTVTDGVGTLVLPSCSGHDQDRITVRSGGTTTYQGPVDSTRPGGGVKRG
jgi:hypothetical protein